MSREALLLLGLGLALPLIVFFLITSVDHPTEAKAQKFRVSDTSYVTFVDKGSFTSCEVVDTDLVAQELTSLDVGLGNGRVLSEGQNHLQYSSVYGTYTYIAKDLRSCIAHTEKLLFTGKAEIPAF